MLVHVLPPEVGYKYLNLVFVLLTFLFEVKKGCCNFFIERYTANGSHFILRNFYADEQYLYRIKFAQNKLCNT